MFEIQTLLTLDSVQLTTSAHGGCVSLKGRIRTSLRKENGGSQYQININKPCEAFRGALPQGNLSQTQSQVSALDVLRQRPKVRDLIEEKEFRDCREGGFRPLNLLILSQFWELA